MQLPPSRPDPEYTYVREHDLREWWESSLQPHSALGYQHRIRLLLDQVHHSVPVGSVVLDVGCAQGTAGLLLAEEGYQVTLIDIREAHIRYARDRYERGDVRFLVGHLAEVTPPVPSFDAIICTEVLEHVPEPAVFLSHIASRLKPQGTLFLTTPNSDYLLSRLPSFGSAPNNVIESTETNSCDGDAHRYLFSREELITLFRGVGLLTSDVGFALPFWTQGHAKTRHAINSYTRLRGRLPKLPKPAVLTGRLARRACCFLVARAHPATPNI